MIVGTNSQASISLLTAGISQIPNFHDGNTQDDDNQPAQPSHIHRPLRHAKQPELIHQCRGDELGNQDEGDETRRAEARDDDGRR